MKITRTSRLSNITRTREINVTTEQLAAWNNGTCIQDAMPNVSADDREFIMTGMTAEEWDALFEETD